MPSNEADTVRDVSKEDAGAALDHLLTLIGAGEDKTGDAYRFLKSWHEGKPMEDYEMGVGVPIHVAFPCIALYSYVTEHDATVRPIAFGRHAEVARLIKGG
jgi:hypothetical protein